MALWLRCLRQLPPAFIPWVQMLCEGMPWATEGDCVAFSSLTMTLARTWHHALVKQRVFSNDNSIGDLCFSENCVPDRDKVSVQELESA